MGTAPKRKARTIAALVGGAIAIAALACLAALFEMRQAAIAPEPTPGGVAENAAESQWPEVDWTYWREVNPDVVGWISIPGTDVSHPIVQAPADSPNYYLDHDAYGNWNPWGAIYLDAECEGGLFYSPNAILYGHHMNDGSMFAPIADYSDTAWAAEHSTILIQTPSDKRTYEVRYANVVNNRSLPKRVEFLGKTDFDAWHASNLSAASSVLDASETPEQVVTLVTCSYSLYGDERTVVTCSEDFESSDCVVSDGSKAAGAKGRKEAVHERIWGAEEVSADVDPDIETRGMATRPASKDGVS